MRDFWPPPGASTQDPPSLCLLGPRAPPGSVCCASAGCKASWPSAAAACALPGRCLGCFCCMAGGGRAVTGACMLPAGCNAGVPLPAAAADMGCCIAAMPAGRPSIGGITTAPPCVGMLTPPHAAGAALPAGWPPCGCTCTSPGRGTSSWCGGGMSGGLACGSTHTSMHLAAITAH